MQTNHKVQEEVKNVVEDLGHVGGIRRRKYGREA
jgi:hypothetical protein